jgi:TatD DNase family protein
VYAAVGVHPHDAAHFPEGEWDGLAELAGGPRVLAVGETGLDYHYDHSPRPAQDAAFRRQVRLARRLGKPVVCHVRDAHVDAQSLLAQEQAAEVGAVIHCFTGNAEEALAYTRLGCHISFSGIITFRGASAEPIRQAAAVVPIDRVLLETDAPYLAPVPLRGKRNEPSYLPHTAAVVAAMRGVPVDVLIAAATENTKRFFRLTDP